MDSNQSMKIPILAQVREWAALAEKATEGPWEAEFPTGVDTQWLDVVAPNGDEILSADPHMRVEIVHVDFTAIQRLETEKNMSNLRLVAASRTAIPALCATVERLVEALKPLARLACPVNVNDRSTYLKAEDYEEAAALLRELEGGKEKG